MLNYINLTSVLCGYSSSVEQEASTLCDRVRLPVPAPYFMKIEEVEKQL